MLKAEEPCELQNSLKNLSTQKVTKNLQLPKSLFLTKIDLWTKIRKDYGEKALDGDFWGYLADKLPVDRTIAQSKYEKIAKLYTESVTFCFPPTTSNLNYEDGRRTEQYMDETQQQTSGAPIPRTPSGTVSYGSFEEYGIWVKKDIVAIEFAETQIEAIKAWLKLQKTKLAPQKASSSLPVQGVTVRDNIVSLEACAYDVTLTPNAEIA